MIRAFRVIPAHKVLRVRKVFPARLAPAGSQGPTGPQGATGLLGDTLAHAVTLITGGYFQSSATFPKVYIDKNGIYGYGTSTADKQFYLDAATGKAYAGGGNVILLDANGQTIAIDSTKSAQGTIKFSYVAQLSVSFRRVAPEG